MIDTHHTAPQQQKRKKIKKYSFVLSRVCVCVFSPECFTFLPLSRYILFSFQTLTGPQPGVPGAHDPHPQQRHQPRLCGETPHPARRRHVRRHDRDLRHGEGGRGESVGCARWGRRTTVCSSGGMMMKRVEAVCWCKPRSTIGNLSWVGDHKQCFILCSSNRSHTRGVE